MTDAEGNEIGKLFIGGLSQSTNNGSLRLYFSRFGEVDDAVVMMDNKTGRSRGFGYIKYRDSGSVTSALSAKPHILDGKEIDAKQCNVNMKGRNRRSLKIFVGGIGLDQDADSIKCFFKQFGRVTDVNLMMDSNKQRHRGFAFVGFEDETVVKRLINIHYVTMNNKQVEIKAMEPPNFTRKIPSTSCVTAASVMASTMHGENTCGQLFDNIVDTSTLLPNGLPGLAAAVPYGLPHPAYLTIQPSALPNAQHQALYHHQHQPPLFTALGSNHGNLGTSVLPDNLYQPATLIQPSSNQYPTRVSSESMVQSGPKPPVPLILTSSQLDHPTGIGVNGVSALGSIGPPLYATIPCHIVPSEYMAHPQQSALAGIGQLINVERHAIHGWQSAGVPPTHLTVCPSHLTSYSSMVPCPQSSPSRPSNSPGLQDSSHNNSSSESLLSPHFTICPQYTTVRLQPEQPSGIQYASEPQNRGHLAAGAGVITYGISSTQPGAGDTIMQSGGNPKDTSPIIHSKAEISSPALSLSSPRIFYPTFMMAALNVSGSTVATSSNHNINVSRPQWNSSVQNLVYSSYPVGWAAHLDPQIPSMQQYESHMKLLPQQFSVTSTINSGPRLSASLAPTADNLQPDTQDSISNLVDHTQMASARASGDESDGHIMTAENDGSYPNKTLAPKVSMNSISTYPFDKSKLESKVGVENRISHDSSKELTNWTQDTRNCLGGTLNNSDTSRWQNPSDCSLSTVPVNHSVLMHHQQPWVLSSETPSISLTRVIVSSPLLDDSSGRCNSASQGVSFVGGRTVPEGVNHQRTLPISSDTSAKTEQRHRPYLSSASSRISQRLPKCEQPQPRLTNHESRQSSENSPDRPSKAQSPISEDMAHGRSATYSTKTDGLCESESAHYRRNITRVDYALWMCENSLGRNKFDTNNVGCSKDIQSGASVGVEFECHGPAGASGDYHLPVHSGQFADYHITHLARKE